MPTPAEWVLIAAGAGWLVAVLVLLFARRWSFWVGVGLAALTAVGLGWAFGQDAWPAVREGVRAARGLEFVRPWWLVLLVFVPVVVLISRRSLGGLGPTRRRLAVGARALGVAALALALAEPRLRRPTENVTTLFVVDRSFSVPQDLDPDKPATEAVDRRWERVRDFLSRAFAERAGNTRDDRFGLILFGKQPRLMLPPAGRPVRPLPIDERLAGPIDGNYTNIAAALKLALASFPESSAKRIVLVSDGNENLGNAEEQAALAKQNGVQIDAIALAPGFRNESEVLVQAVDAPPAAAGGQRLPIRVTVRNAIPNRVVEGRLEVARSGGGPTGAVEIEDGPQVLDPRSPPKVRLLPGLNVFRFRDRAAGAKDEAVVFKASFTPTGSRSLDGGNAVAGAPGDRPANNQATAVTITRGQRRVLFLDDSRPGTAASSHEFLLDALRREKVRVDRLPAADLPADKTQLGAFLANFDSVVIANVPYERFTQDQAELLRTTVFDQGCGLVMIGGTESFGAGGYQGTPIEAALPVDCEIKALKAAGKGGLVLIMHASEMADGNKWQKDIAKLAIRRLGPIDMVGVAQYGWGGPAVSWVIPFQTVGTEREGLLAKVDGMVPGDMPNFDPFLKAAADTLKDPQHQLSVKHTIIISDGDPQYGPAGKAATADMAANSITCTTVGVATHGAPQDKTMKDIAEATADGNGKPGTYYKVSDPNQLPAIYIKESRRVSQSFVAVGKLTPLWPSDRKAEVLPEKVPLPPLYGYIRTTLKSNALAGMELEAPSPFPDQRFPIVASWRYGLGKAVAFTSDALTQPGGARQYWDKDWAGGEGYQKFWKQVVEWSLREAERGRLTLATELRDGKVVVRADVRDEQDKPVTGLALRAGLTTPSPAPAGEKPPTVEFKPKGGGTYEAEFPADEAGAYFLNVQAQEPARDAAGNLVPGPDGKPAMRTVDAARAGVTVPYSPEFADLESNTPLLRRLADITGGQFHTEEAADLEELLRTGDLFREAPQQVRAVLPFWFWLVFAAAFLLLFDVAVRRIAVEWAEVRRAGGRVWSRLRQQPAAAGDDAGLGQLLRRKAAVAETIDRSKAVRRFDPAAAPAAEPAPAGADEYARRAGDAPPPPAAPAGDREQSQSEAEPDDPMERLRRARDRARQRRTGPGESTN